MFGAEHMSIEENYNDEVHKDNIHSKIKIENTINTERNSE